MLVLDKMSMPGWQFKSEHIEQIFWLLDQSVCDYCKMTKKEYDQIIPERECNDDGSDYYPEDLLPETYDSWSALEKVEWLMGTACGCEFDFYDEADGSGWKFVEINT